MCIVSITIAGILGITNGLLCKSHISKRLVLDTELLKSVIIPPQNSAHAEKS